MLRNGKIAEELEVIAPRQYALITVGHTVNHLFALRGCWLPHSSNAGSFANLYPPIDHLYCLVLPS